MNNQLRTTTSRFLILALIFMGLISAQLPAYADILGKKEIYSVEFVKKNLIKGKTTEDEVRQKFGNPHKIDRILRDRGTEEVRYFYNRKQRTGGLIGLIKSKIPGSAASLAYGSAQNKASDAKRFGTYASGGTQENGYESLSITFSRGIVTGYTLDD